MFKKITKTTIYIMMLMMAWLPVQSSFAQSFMLSGSGTNLNASTAEQSHQNHAMHGQYSQNQYNQDSVAQQDSSHCNTKSYTQTSSDCCSSMTSCDIPNHDCQNCVSFVAITSSDLRMFSSQTLNITTSHQPTLTGIKHLLDDRPPCFI